MCYEQSHDNRQLSQEIGEADNLELTPYPLADV